MASSSFSSSFLYPPRRPLFTPISEHASEEEDGSSDITTSQEVRKSVETTPNKHHSTRLHDTTVDYNKCRPSNYGCSGTYNSSVVKSVFASLTSKASPHLSSHPSNSANHRVENWKLVAAELSRKLHHTTRKHDEALTEVSQLKQSVSELEKNVIRLNAYCRDLEFLVSSTNNHRTGGNGSDMPMAAISMENSFPLDDFLQALQESRSMVRQLGRSLLAEICQCGLDKTLDQIGLLLKPYNVRVSSTSRSLFLYLEALLNRVFYEDFESTGFKQGGSELILDPYARCISNQADYEALKRLSWEDVLSNGTWHHSQGLSMFCDQKMSDVMTMLRWEQVWPEPLLQAFFRAAKWVWLVHLLAWSVHPVVPMFRVDKGMQFEPHYMEDIAMDRVRVPVTKMVRLMVAPGFYVYSNVIKCKVVCMYNNKNRCDLNSNTV